MGRQQYLTRMAVGRSAFADLEDDEPTTGRNTQIANNASSGSPYIQQYDSKGRPQHPKTTAANAAHRDAENAALALVGVVERKDTHDRLTELRYKTITSVREAVLADEHEAGENLELIATLLAFSSYATETLIRRVQAGLYSSADTFTSILLHGFEALRSPGALAVLFPGAPTAIAHAAIRLLLGATLSTGVDYLSQWLTRQRLHRKTAKRVNHALYFLCEALLIGVDIALLPLDYHAHLQQLGLAPARPLLPPWRTLLPFDPTSPHTFIWHSTSTSNPLLTRLLSSAALLLAQSTLHREQDPETPLASQLTAFAYPATFNLPPWTTIRPRPLSDPLGWLLYQAYIARVRCMRALGYTLEHSGRLSTPRVEFEMDRPVRESRTRRRAERAGEAGRNSLFTRRRRDSPSFTPLPSSSSSSSSSSDSDEDNAERDGLQHGIHRSTSLAHLLPSLLSQRFDAAFAGLLYLPLQGAVMRSLVQSTSTPTSSPISIIATASGGGTGELGAYLSKLGLALSLHALNATGVLFAVYGLVRWRGTRGFDWGKSGEIGGLVYPGEGEE